MLHILRTEPDEATLELIEGMPLREKTHVLHLYDETPDWDQIVDQIFAHDKIICWW